MSAISDEDLMRFADGELSPAAAAAIEARLPLDAELRRRFDVFLVTRAPIAAVFDDVLAEPVPDRLVAAIMRSKPAQPSAPQIAPKTIGWAGRLHSLWEGTLAALTPAQFSPAFAAGIAAAVLLGRHALAGSRVAHLHQHPP